MAVVSAHSHSAFSLSMDAILVSNLLGRYLADALILNITKDSYVDLLESYWLFFDHMFHLLYMNAEQT